MYLHIIKIVQHQYTIHPSERERERENDDEDNNYKISNNNHHPIIIITVIIVKKFVRQVLCMLTRVVMHVCNEAVMRDLRASRRAAYSL